MDQDKRGKLGIYVGKRAIAPQHDGERLEATETSHPESSRLTTHALHENVDVERQLHSPPPLRRASGRLLFI